MADIAPTKTFLQEKQSCIGGTAASAILGVNPFKTRHEVWLELTGLADGSIRMNQRIEAGIRLEPYVADWFLDEMKNRGEKIRLADGPFVLHPEYPFIGGHPDRLVLNGKPDPIAGLEIKTTDARNWWMWGEPGSDEIPDMYQVQCQHYMMITGLNKWYLAVLLGGNDFRIYTLERNERLIGHLLTAEVDFWQNYVLPKNPPAVDSSEGSSKMLRRVYATDDGSVKDSDGSIDPVVDRLFEVKAAIKELETEETGCKNQIQEYMGCAVKLVGSGYTVSWSTTKDREVVDFSKVCREMADRFGIDQSVLDSIIAEFTETKPGYRTFRATQKKAK